jgi:hypothetical protein
LSNKKITQGQAKKNNQLFSGVKGRRRRRGSSPAHASIGLSIAYFQLEFAVIIPYPRKIEKS